jgi:ATP-binding cassette subfamily B (MDR/TAP) protein 1
MTFVVGQSFDTFAQFPLTPNPPQAAKDALLHGVGLAALELIGLAFGSLVLGSITSFLWIWAGEINVMFLRKAVYTAVTQKDMGWFDMRMGATEGTIQATTEENQQGPIGAGGLMAKFSRSVVPFFSRPHVLSTVCLCTEKSMRSAWRRLWPLA